MPKTVTLRVDDDTYEILSKRAVAERRPLSNFIEMAALEFARRTEFVDDEEMREIVSNARLVKSLREGSRQDRKKKGRFVA